MHPTKSLALVTVLLWGAGLAELAANNAETAPSPPENATRVWISSFRPITVTIDHKDGVPRPATPEIPERLGLEWRSNYAVLSQHLLSGAEKAQLDLSSLRKIFSTVWDSESSNWAILPVEAMSTQFKGQPVWVVVLRWEVGGGYLIHVPSLTFNRQTLKLVNMQSCD